MPKWSEYLQTARERGALALELYCVHSTPAADPDTLKAVLPDHLAYQAQLEADGALVLAGPMSDESGDLMEGMGMIVYRAESLEAARALADADPMHKAGARTYVLRRWMVNEGNLTLNVRLSAPAARLS